MKLLFNVFLFLIDAYVDAAGINNVDSKNTTSDGRVGAHSIRGMFYGKGM